MGKRRRGEARDGATWEEATVEERSGKRDPRVECNHCGKVWHSTSLERLETYLLDCKRLPNSLWERFNRGACAPKRGRVQSTLNAAQYSIPRTEHGQLRYLLVRKQT